MAMSFLQENTIRVPKWVCIYRPGSVILTFGTFGSVKGLYLFHRSVKLVFFINKQYEYKELLVG